jgi:hypothetical protein
VTLEKTSSFVTSEYRGMFRVVDLKCSFSGPNPALSFILQTDMDPDLNLACFQKDI